MGWINQALFYLLKHSISCLPVNSDCHCELDVRTVLKNHIDHEFILVPGIIGGQEGDLWWFKDTSVIPHYEIPLSERVEQTVLRKLLSEYKVTFTDVWKSVSIEFPNSLTSDSLSLKDILEEYARKEPGSAGYWKLKPIVTQRETQHAQIISLLADIGSNLGFNTWIGLKEQTSVVKGSAGSEISLSEWCNPKTLKITGLDKDQLSEASRIDLLWYKNGIIDSIFEVENTTAMTEALRRASSLPYQTEKFMVLPDERLEQLSRKMKSPMFKDQFEKDNWQTLYYDALQDNAAQLKDKKKSVQDIIGKLSNKKQSDSPQLELF